MRCWIDTDVGDNPDDAVALLVAARHPAIELVGISTVDGDHDRRRAVAASLVDVPAVAGDDPGLVAAVRAAAPDAVLAIGPLTNIARLVDAGVLPTRLVAMGGALGPVVHRGVRVTVEHNIGRDPAAAARVRAAGLALRLVPLDVTVSMVLDDRQWDRLLAAAPVLEPEVRRWSVALRELGVPSDAARLCLHDPLALLALAGDPVVTTEPRHLAVTPDGRVRADDHAPHSEVVVAADREAALARVLELLASPCCG